MMTLVALYCSIFCMMSPLAFAAATRMFPTGKPEMMASDHVIAHRPNDDDDGYINGTVPVQRENVLNFHPMELHGRKILDSTGKEKHEHAVAIAKGDDDIYRDIYVGARASFNTWKPYVERRSDFSLAQVWIVSRNGPNRNSIEAGWQVYPQIYGDFRPRFFIFYTNDNYKTGCYNDDCEGFVQTNYSIIPGNTIKDVSSYKGNQYSIKIEISKDAFTDDWWLKVDDMTVGYFPSSVVPELSDGASEIHWGGEVAWINNGRHTATHMGSGHFPEEGFRKASYVRNMEVMLYNRRYWIPPPTDLEIRATNPNCYRIKMHFSGDWQTHFYYGGSGRDRISCK